MASGAPVIVDGVDSVDGVDDVDMVTENRHKGPSREAYAEGRNLCVVRLDYRPGQHCISVGVHECSRPSDQVMCRYFTARDELTKNGGA